MRHPALITGQRTTALIAFIGSLFGATLVAAQTTNPATPEMAINGVAYYVSTAVAGGTDVSLYDSSDDPVGSALVSVSATGEIASVWSGVDGKSIRVEQDGSGDRYTLTDQVSSISGKISYDHQAKTWLVDAGATQVFQNNGPAVALCAACLSAGAPAETVWIDNPSPPVLPQGGLECLGPECRGNGYSAAKSACCAEAHRAMGECCSNQYCWGCCYVLPCDALCALQDYFCLCGQTGTACSGNSELELIFSSPSPAQ